MCPHRLRCILACGGPSSQWKFNCPSSGYFLFLAVNFTANLDWLWRGGWDWGVPIVYSRTDPKLFTHPSHSDLRRNGWLGQVMKMILLWGWVWGATQSYRHLLVGGSTRARKRMKRTLVWPAAEVSKLVHPPAMWHSSWVVWQKISRENARASMRTLDWGAWVGR